MAAVLVFRNRQRLRSLNLPLLRRIARHVLETDLSVSNYELGLHFVNTTEMARVNQTFLQHKGSTDIITFDHNAGEPLEQLHGEIFISIPDAVTQAREFSTTWQSEVVRYVIHGLLHLRGHDDLQPNTRRVMKREENRLLRKIARLFPLANVARPRRSQPSTSNSQLD